jgi:hypothetical protein
MFFGMAMPSLPFPIENRGRWVEQYHFRNILKGRTWIVCLEEISCVSGRAVVVHLMERKIPNGPTPTIPPSSLLEFPPLLHHQTTNQAIK